MMKRSILLMACLGVCALLVTACGKQKTFSAGTEMSAEEAQAYRERLLAEGADGQAPDAEPEEENAEILPPAVCYYTEKGSKWHIHADCQYLQNSKDVLEGTLEGAALAGKTGPCSRCAAMYIEE